MLICPTCQFRNPDHHNFCQQCGTSLLEQACQQCGTQTAFTQINCPSCGAQVGQLWWTILMPGAVDVSQVPADWAAQGTDLPRPSILNATHPEPEAKLSVLASARPRPTAESTIELATQRSLSLGDSGQQRGELQPEDITIPLLLPQTTPIVSDFLDAQQRYQILGPLEIVSTSEQGRELEGPVLDCNPLRLTPIETLVEEMQLLGQSEDFSEPVTAVAYLAQDGQLPEIAFPYLALYLQFPQAIPKLQNAWWQPVLGKAAAELSGDQTGSVEMGNAGMGNADMGTVPVQQVLVLTDYSGLPELLSAWQQDELPMLQLLRGLEEMLDLWVALEPWGYCHSLLKLNNLRVNQNGFLALRRLHYQDIDIPEPGLALANVWRSLFNLASPRRQRDLASLGRELAQRSIQSLADLELLLADVVRELQQTCPESWSVANPATFHAPGFSTASHQPPGPSPITLPAAEVTQAWAKKTSAGDSPTAILPYQLKALESGALTDVGRDRQQNEDYFLLRERASQTHNPQGQQKQYQGLYILCDGMGGHAEGEVASSLAACSFYQHLKTHWQEHFPDEAMLLEAVTAANQAIYRINEEKLRAGSGRMGTTLIAVLVQDNQVRVVHVGDSRLYCYTESRGLEQLTIDHEVGQREIRRGVDPEQAYSRFDAYQLTQALGPKDAVFLQPEVQSFEVTEDSLLLLCSDGLSDRELLETHASEQLSLLLKPETNLQSGLKPLIDLANRYNGHDNITAIAVRLQVQVQVPTLS